MFPGDGSLDHYICWLKVRQQGQCYICILSPRCKYITKLEDYSIVNCWDSGMSRRSIREGWKRTEREERSQKTQKQENYTHSVRNCVKMIVLTPFIFYFNFILLSKNKNTNNLKKKKTSYEKIMNLFRQHWFRRSSGSSMYHMVGGLIPIFSCPVLGQNTKH